MNLNFIQPEFLTPFMLGFSTYFLLKLWKKWKGFLITIFLLWVYFVWFSVILLMFRSKPETHTIAYFVGFSIAFSWAFLKSSFAVFQYIADKIQDVRFFIADRRRSKQSEWAYQRQSTGYQQDRKQREREAEAERARREAEARAYRESQNKQKNQNQQSNGYHEEKPHEKRQERQGYQNNNQNRERDRIKDHYEPPENRSYEQILGLSGEWTQEDLKKAYKRESQRLHPDKWVGKPRHIQQAMEEEFKTVQEAYVKLKKRHR